MTRALLVGLAVAVAVGLGAALARRTRIPAPCYLVLAGLAVGFLPGVGDVHLPPDVVFYGFLPPLLYSAAFLTVPREVRDNWLSILLLAVGLTAATLFAVAGVAWAAIAALGAGSAFLLGAVLGPTDPVSATAVIGATSAPSKLRTILEAESLVNDGVGLVAFSVALAAVEHGSLSVGDGVAKFVQLSAGGIALGIAVAFLVERLRRRIHGVVPQITISLLTPFAAYVPAESVDVSGILATVACGMYLGWRADGLFRPEVRAQSRAFWNVLTFVLGSVLFVLLGMQFRPVLAELHGFSAGTLLGAAAMAASFMVSYTRAKSESLGFTPGTGMANVGLAPREVRLVLVTVGLLLTGWNGGIVAPITVAGLVDMTWWAGRPVLAGTLGLITILATITTIQRIVHVIRQPASKEQE